MKKVVTVAEVTGEGLEALLGEQVILLCMNYFYAGKLVGLNERFALLEDGGIVYETGAWSNKTWTDFQAVDGPLYVMLDKVEAFARGKHARA